jgi:hypothetical protein
MRPRTGGACRLSAVYRSSGDELGQSRVVRFKT